jgi:hypothetical protein
LALNTLKIGPYLVIFPYDAADICTSSQVKYRETAMKKFLLASLMAFMCLALTGCGDGSSGPSTFLTRIYSDATYDGYIRKAFSSGTFTVTQGMSQSVQSVFAGIDPVSLDESRAFLHFSLTDVPVDAIIVSAHLDIVIDSIQPQPLSGTIPIRIDLVSFSPPDLLDTDFDRAVLATTIITPPISQFDLGQHVSIDVTTLMDEAQRLGLSNFQIRIMEDTGAVSPGLIEINDTTGPDWPTLAPLLEVVYY